MKSDQNIFSRLLDAVLNLYVYRLQE